MLWLLVFLSWLLLMLLIKLQMPPEAPSSTPLVPGLFLKLKFGNYCYKLDEMVAAE
jgi:hypothetical protein